MTQMAPIRWEVADQVGLLSFNRPEKKNAMSDDMRSEFIRILEAASLDKSVHALVLTGLGDAFCAGGDINGMKQRMQAPAGELGINGWRRQQRVQHAQALLFNLPKPTIAAVNGAASGLGADIALACDFIIASEKAAFAWSYIRRGIIPDGGGMYLLPRRVGLPRAKELIFSGRSIGLQEALEIGLVDRSAGSHELVDQAKTWARELGANASPALELSKTILNQTFESSIHQIFAQGSQAQGICYTSTAHHAAVADFLNRNQSR